MRIEHIVWDSGSISHIARHGVGPDEVEEACFGGGRVILKTRFNRYILLGQADSGRYLTIVFAYLENKAIKIITARAMSEAERKYYKRR